MSQNPESPATELTDIFINYRRADTSGHAGRLEQELSRRFPGRVFMDIHTIEVGTDFADAINREVGKCGALIVLIGNQWLDITDAKTGKRRLDNPNDFVALEIAEALKRNTRVIPVLVEGAKMPEAEELPASLAALVRRNAFEITDTRWDYDVAQLIKVLEKICGVGTLLGKTRTGTGDGTTTGKGTGDGNAATWGVAKIAIISAVAALLVIALIIYSRSGKTTPQTAAVPAQSPALPADSPANPPDVAAELKPSVTADLAADKSVFVFPFETKGNWKLGEGDEEDYSWEVYVNQHGTQHYLGLLANNVKGNGLESGLLEVLLNEGEVNFVWKTVIGNSADWREVTEPKMEFAYKILDKGLELTVTGKGVKTIFAKDPTTDQKHATLRMKTPKSTATKVFDASIEYK